MIGQSISHYKITEKLGSGGMGVVYKAIDTKLDRPVALKFLPPELTRDSDAKHRFVHEAKAASALQHNNICTIHEIDETEDGHLFIAMDCYMGETLKQRIAGGQLPLHDSIDIAIQAAEGLSKAHQAGMVHRDVKPANIMITSDGVVKIVDFGLAKLAGQTKVTKTGTTVGTVAYMSPEQARGEEVDHRSDIFSLGVIFYEMLAGELPFKGEHEAAILYEIVHEEHEPISKIRAEVPPEMERIVDRCIAKDRDERYQTVSEFISDITRLKKETGKVSAVTGKGVYRRAPGKVSRKWFWILPFAVIAALLIIFNIWVPGEKSGETDRSLETITSARPNWILVAEFDGPKNDPDLASTVRELVITTLNESKLVKPLSNADLKRGLELAMKPDSTRVSGSIAQELAYRAGARTYIEGQVSRIGSVYTIVLNVIDTETGSYIFPISGSAESKDAIVTAIDLASRELRKKLGENIAAIEATRDARDIITPSFEAYCKYVHAHVLHGEMRYRLSNETVKVALGLDREFAAAYSLLGYNYNNMGYKDTAAYYFEEALKRPERLTERHRLSLEALIRMWFRREFHDALQRYDVLLEKYNYDHNNRGITLALLGRREEALEMYRANASANPYGSNDISLWNLTETLLVLGRYEEAREQFPKFRNPMYWGYFELMTAAATSNWTIADSIAGSPGFPRPQRGVLYLAARDLAKGSVQAARRRYTEMWDGEFINFNYMVCLVTTMLSAITRSDDIRLGYTICSDSTMRGLIIQSVHAAASGDTIQAQRHITDIKKKSIYEQRTFAPEITMVETYAAMARRDWDAVGRHTEFMTARHQSPQFSYGLPIQWVIAEAYEELGESEKAVEYFERILSPKELEGSLDFLVRVAFCTFAHQRLAMLYSQLGRTEEAKWHFEVFRKMFTDPDPELVWMLDEARSAILPANSIKK